MNISTVKTEESFVQESSIHARINDGEIVYYLKKNDPISEKKTQVFTTKVLWENEKYILCLQHNIEKLQNFSQKTISSKKYIQYCVRRE